MELQLQYINVSIDKNTIKINNYPISIQFLEKAIDCSEQIKRVSATIGCATLSLDEAKLIRDTYYQINPKV